MNVKLNGIYAKDISFENPLAPGVFGEAWNPEVELHLHSGGARLAENRYEATLKVGVDARIGDRPSMVIEVVVAGLFDIEGANGEELEHALGVTCPAILFPYAREVVTTLSVRGGFPPFLLQPTDFEQLYRQRREASGPERTEE